jgi:hypothetical protein
VHADTNTLNLLNNMNLDMDGTSKSEYSDNSEHLAGTEL